MITPELKATLVQYAQDCYPQEACGLIVGEVFIPISNVSAQPDEGFVMCPQQLAEALDRFEPTAIFHSHPDDTAAPSEHDVARINRADDPLPWVIVSVPDLELSVTYPTAHPALIGRKFIHGVDDCYSLLVDFYAAKMGIELHDYAREDEWWEKGQNLYLDNFAAEGFHEVPMSELQYGDVILMQVLSDTVNHAGIYIGDGQILHHLYGRLSRRDVYGGYWLDRTSRTIRHSLYNACNVKPLLESDNANHY